MSKEIDGQVGGAYGLGLQVAVLACSGGDSLVALFGMKRGVYILGTLIGMLFNALKIHFIPIFKFEALHTLEFLNVVRDKGGVVRASYSGYE